MLNNPHASWTCDGQRLGVIAVLQARADVLSILATGTGKTMQVIIPILMEPRQTTVVILPLKALVTDYQRRLDAMDIRYQVWKTYSNNPHAIRTDVNLILVTIEQAQKAVFKEELVKAHRSQPIKRFVFDEAHTALLAESYRQSMRHIDELRHMLPVQFVLMSGTIPPNATAALRERFGVMPNAVEIRTKSIRPEIQYMLERPLKTWGHVPIALRAKQLVEHYSPEFRPEDRGLIYVETKRMNEIIREKINIVRYEGGQSMTDEERQAAYCAWTEGESKWMTCTSAFGAGVDWATVRVVIFAGSPRRMSDMIQESDRCGRDGRHALVFILTEPESTYQPNSNKPSAETSAYIGEAVMRDCLYKIKTGREGCLRYQLSRYNDGVGTACTDLTNAAYCSHCHTPAQQRNELPRLTRKRYTYQRPLIEASVLQKRSADAAETSTIEEHHRSIQRRRAVRLNDVRQRAETLKNALNKRLGLCHLCLFLSSKSGSEHHLFLRCSLLTKERETLYRQFRQLIQFPRYTTSTAEDCNTCFRCGVPQLEDLHDTFSSTSCRWDDQIMVFAWLVWYVEEERHRCEADLGVTWSTMKAYCQWLVQPGAGGLYHIHDLYIAWVERHSL